MQEEQIRTVLDTHWRASAIGDANAEHDIYDDDAIWLQLQLEQALRDVAQAQADERAAA